MKAEAALTTADECGLSPEHNSPEYVRASWHSTIDKDYVRRICLVETLAEMETALPPELTPQSLGTWMVWMVHRVSLNDPEVTTLDFTNWSMPSPKEEPRMVPKLLKALAGNTHLLTLSLRNSEFQGAEQAQELGRSLSKNTSLEVLNLDSNHLTPSDLQVIFQGLAHNATLKEMRCTHQFNEHNFEAQELRQLYAAVNEVLRTNRTLQKLGMELTERHYRDQITKKLIRNTEETRKRRKTEADRKVQDEHRSPIGGA
jgi:hypothetical protein